MDEHVARAWRHVVAVDPNVTAGAVVPIAIDPNRSIERRGRPLDDNRLRLRRRLFTRSSWLRLLNDDDGFAFDLLGSAVFFLDDDVGGRVLLRDDVVTHVPVRADHDFHITRLVTHIAVSTGRLCGRGHGNGMNEHRGRQGDERH
jgi:hypothetical protein